MITEPIVFVLGAGSMKDYGFPIGWELVRDVISKFSINTTERELFLKNSDFSSKDVEEFIAALDGSAQNSVDAFLEGREGFLEVGIALMSAALILNERPHSLYQERDPEKNWLRNLLQHMRSASFEDFGNNKVSFITFNYDRSLEYFLCRSLSDSYGKSEVQAGKIIEKIPIKHLHGQLGYLPWQVTGSTRPYDANINRATLKACIDHVKVVNRNIEPAAAVFKEAKELITGAYKVYFLGVGFYNQNMTRLGVFDLPKDKAVSTGKGLTATEHRSLLSRFDGHLAPLMNMDCIGVLRDFIDWNRVGS